MFTSRPHPPNPPLPLLISGVAGVTGYNAFHYFRSHFDDQVIGIRQVNNWPLRGLGIVPCNAEDRDGLEKLFEQYQFAAVLNCAGNCALKSCELDPALARRTNVESVENLVHIIDPDQTRLVHLSIDLVFSGVGNGGYTESCQTDPVTVYGKTMVEAEKIVLAASSRNSVLRISLPMGVSFNGHAGAIDWIQARFKQSKPATLYYDEIRTPTYTDCLNELCRTVLGSDLSGIFHAGGPRRLSLYQIAQIVNRVGGYDPDHLMGCPRIEAGPVPPRAGNVTLDSSKLAAAVGFAPFDPWPANEEFVPTHDQWHRERSGIGPGSPELLAQALYLNPWRAATRLHG